MAEGLGGAGQVLESRGGTMIFTERTKQSVFRSFAGKCCCCGSRQALQYHHIVPRHVYKGSGSNSFLNCVLVCQTCHMREFHRGRWSARHADAALLAAANAGLPSERIQHMKAHVANLLIKAGRQPVACEARNLKSDQMEKQFKDEVSQMAEKHRHHIALLKSSIKAWRALHDSRAADAALWEKQAAMREQQYENAIRARDEAYDLNDKYRHEIARIQSALRQAHAELAMARSKKRWWAPWKA